MQVYSPVGLNHRQLIAGSFLALIAEHLCIWLNSAKAPFTLLSSMTDAATGLLVPLSVTEHYTSEAMSIETAQV